MEWKNGMHGKEWDSMACTCVQLFSSAAGPRTGRLLRADGPTGRAQRRRAHAGGSTLSEVAAPTGVVAQRASARRCA